VNYHLPLWAVAWDVFRIGQFAGEAAGGGRGVAAAVPV